MTLLASLNRSVAKLVHPAKHGTPSEFFRHRDFIATRVTISLGALVAAPVCLALGNAPAWWETGALAWLLLPLGAVAFVARTGDLGRGAILSLAAWIGLASTLALASGSATGLGLLLIVPFEAALTLASLTLGAMVAVAAAAGIALLAPLFPYFLGVPQPDPRIVHFGTGLFAAAEVYAVLLSLLAARRQTRCRLDDQGEQDRHRELCALIDEVPLRLDRSGLVLDAPAAAHRLCGLGGRDLLGRGLFDQVHVADRPAFLTLVADAAEGRSTARVTVRVRTGATVPSERGSFQEPVFVWIEMKARRGVLIEGDSCPSILVLLRDVTAYRRMEEALRHAEVESHRTETGRTLFLANVSHELRTPLNAIIGFADMLTSERYGPRDPLKQREYASIILQSGQHLLAMVNTILDASKIEAGSFSISPEVFDLVRLIHGCCDMVGLKAETGAIEVIRNIPAEMPEVIGDERAYKQILLNLLSNALKFTSAGGRVVVTARPEGHSIILSVADNGVGISGSDLPKLGAPFFQAESAYDRTFDGTGLGLSVVRGLVGLHGGSMTIESAPSLGTRVSIRLPSDCRAHMRASAGQTKIETIPRYAAAVPASPASQDVARMHKIA